MEKLAYLIVFLSRSHLWYNKASGPNTPTENTDSENTQAYTHARIRHTNTNTHTQIKSFTH